MYKVGLRNACALRAGAVRIGALLQGAASLPVPQPRRVQQDIFRVCR